MDAVLLSRHTFRKTERLASRKLITELVEKGRVIHGAPLRLTWLPVQLPVDVPAQIAFSVPKRNFKKATDRNRLKRLMREVYRKNKSEIYPFLSESKKQYAVLLHYSGKSLTDYHTMEEKIKIILQRFAKDTLQDIQ